MSAELTWVLMAFWFVVIQSAINELLRIYGSRAVAGMTSVSARLVQCLSEQAHSAIHSLKGTDRAIRGLWRYRTPSDGYTLGVLGRQMPEVRRRDPRAVPGGNLTDPIQSTTLMYG